MSVNFQSISSSFSVWLTAVVSLFFIGGISTVHAVQIPPVVVAMIENGPQNAVSRCGYVRHRQRDDGSVRERYLPGGLETPWILLSVDGRAPSVKEKRRYLAKREKRSTRRHPLAFDIREIADAGSWSVVGEKDGEATFHFKLEPTRDFGVRVAPMIRGILVIDPARNQPKKIRIESVEPVYVKPFVRITEYWKEMGFAWNEEVDAATLIAVVTHQRGSAFGIKSIDKNQRTRYGDYDCKSSS
jgi:hypothetical protein